MKTLFAYTKPGIEYPGYANISQDVDGLITIYIRADAKDGKCGESLQIVLPPAAGDDLIAAFK